MIKVREHYTWFISIFLIFFSFSIISKKFINNPDEELRQLLINDNCIKQVLFPSKHNIPQTIVHLIKNEKKSIKVAIFLITDKSICNALIEAKKRNIDVEVITCHSNINTIISQLIDNNIDVFIFGAPSTKKGLNNAPIMHNKFIIFEQNLDNKSLFLNGSFNLTVKAQAKNKENILVLEDKFLLNQFINEFQNIKNQSKLLSKPEKKYSEKADSKKEMSLAEKFKKSFHILIGN